MNKLLTIAEAALVLGKTPRGMRELIDRSRRAARGSDVSGATIRFAQDGRGGTILFKHEWLDEYIDGITVNPSRGVTRSERTRPRRANMAPLTLESF